MKSELEAIRLLYEDNKSASHGDHGLTIYGLADIIKAVCFTTKPDK